MRYRVRSYTDLDIKEVRRLVKWIEQITPELGSGATDAKSAARDEPAHGFPDVGSRDAPHTDLDLIVFAVRLLLREYQAEIGRLHDAYERVRPEVKPR